MPKNRSILFSSYSQTTAIRVALVVGTILFGINHGQATIKGKMTQNRWLAGVLTYLVPYCVSLHGQYSASKRGNKTDS